MAKKNQRKRTHPGQGQGKNSTHKLETFPISANGSNIDDSGQPRSHPDRLIYSSRRSERDATSLVERTRIEHFRHNSTLAIRTHWFAWLGICLCVLLALVPFLHLASYIANTGANNPSNDYLVYSGLIDRIFSGTYNWRNYFLDTFHRSHCLAIPFLARLAIIKLTNWNMYDELYLGIFLGVLKVLLLFDAFTTLVKRAYRWTLLPMLAALVFSASQTTDYGYGDAALPIGFTQLGMALAIWALVRFPGRRVGIALAASGGILGTFSGGGGLPIWPALFLGLVLLGNCNVRHYGTILIAMLLSLVPYVLFSGGDPTTTGVSHVAYLATHSADPSGFSFFDSEFIPGAIGLPFGARFPILQTGWIGLGLAAIGFALLAMKRRTTILPHASAAIMVIVYGLGNIWLISTTRGRGLSGMAPWYTMHFMPFWLGLLGLAYVLWVHRMELRRKRDLDLWRLARSAGAAVWVAVVFLLIAVLYLGSQPGSPSVALATSAPLDNTFYLHSRAPVSESCLRNYRTAPTYCEGHVFQWGIGHPSLLAILAEPLERHSFSMFAPDQEWTLQGDYILNTVRVHEVTGSAPVKWENAGTPTDFTDFHHLDLVLPTPDTLSWTVALPAGIQSATFHSAVRLTGPVSVQPGVRVFRGTEAGHSAPLRDIRLPSTQSWKAVNIPLSAYAGRTITLEFTSGHASAQSQSRATFQYPVIDLHLRSGAHLAPAPSMDTFSGRDYSLDLSRVDPRSTYTLAEYGESLNQCLADYNRLSIRMIVPASPAASIVTLNYSTDGKPTAGVTPPTQIPVFADGAVHTYTYDFKLFAMPVGVHLTWIKLTPSYAQASGFGGRLRTVRIDDARLVRNAGPTLCHSSRSGL
ncbi:MAG: hypothetical protein NVSMB52_02770 [Chloroflexota bacterium]